MGYREYFNLHDSSYLALNPKKIKNTIDEVKCLTNCVKAYDKSKKLDTVTCVNECLQNIESVNLAESVNWVEKGAVTPVKDQGQCGSCWSFSTTGALEGAYYIKHNDLKSFSEQQLVSCDTLRNGGKDHGCNGGLMDNAFKWIEGNDGLCLEADYPYVSGTTKQSETCIETCSVVSGSDIVDYKDVNPSSDDDMMSALSQ